MVGTNFTSAAVVEAGCSEAITAGGLRIAVLFDAATSSVTVNGIPVTAFDIGGDYGVLHGIEGVMVEGVLGEFVPCPPPPFLTPIADEGDYGILLEAIVGSGLFDDLTAGDFPITIFGPKNAAFEAIADTVADLSQEEVKAILLNHIILGANVTSADVVAAGCVEVPTAGGLMLGINFDAEASSVTINGVTASAFDVFGDYGVLHGIDEVLLGDFVPCPAFEADFSPIAEKGMYNTLLTAVVATGNDAVISASAPVTIFGPKDSAFTAIQDTVDALSPEELSAVLLNHVIVGATVTSSVVVEAGCIEAKTAGGMMVAVRYNATTNVVDVNGIVVNDFDIAGDYGIMHGMEGVLVDPDAFVACPIPTFVEQVFKTMEYTTLTTLLSDPALQSQLDSAGPITVFGPNDAAFAALGDALDGIDESTLLMTLGGHVVNGVYTAADVKAAGCVILTSIVGTTIRAMYVEGDDHDEHDEHDEHDDHDEHDHRKLAGHLADEKEMGHIMINDAEVILADIADATSIFHGLDKVLLGGETFACPTEAPVAAPTTAADEEAGSEDSSAAFSGVSAVVAAVVALSAFAL